MPAPSAIAANLASCPDFNRRCQLIAEAYAVNVVLLEDPGTANHVNRAALASKVVSGALSPEVLARVALTDPNIQAAAIADAANNGAAVADVNIDGRLQAVWNALANATL